MRCTLLFCLSLLTLPVTANAQQTLLATPTTVAWGYYSAKAKPVLTVHSGDTVKIQTLSTCGAPERLKDRPLRGEGHRQGTGRPHPHRAGGDY
jgi:hypothetical protein